MPTNDSFSSTTITIPTVTSSVNISSSTSSQAHTFPSTLDGSTQTVTKLHSDSPSITTEILTTTETFQLSTSGISSTTLSTTPTSESTTQYSATKKPGFQVMQDLATNLTVSGVNWICIKTCRTPDSYRVNLNFTMKKENPKLNYTMEAISK
jgi:hypothetical protein